MSFADVARVNEVKTASIHYHFPGKAALGVALMKRYAKTMADTWDQTDARKLTVREKLEGTIARYRDTLNGGETICLCVAMSVSRDNLAEPIVVEMRAFRKMMLRGLERLYEQANTDRTLPTTGSPAAKAAATVAMLEGAQLTAHTENDPSRFDIATSLLVSDGS